MSRILDLKKGILAKNDTLAATLRQTFEEAAVAVSNWVSSPGTGKTALLEATLGRARDRGLTVAALVGDCATDNDARRLARSGAPVRQIVTEGMCHLEADMIAGHLTGWDVSDLDLLIIENVGNLVCPSGFDLGEDTRVALLSVTEGEDKPMKYPHIFQSADLVVVTKTDLADAVEWNREAALAAVRATNPNAPVIETSARTGAGLDEILDHLLAGAAAAAKQFTTQEAP